MRQGTHRSAFAGRLDGRGDRTVTRRRALLGISGALIGATAGCTSLPGQGPPEDQSYDRLQQTAVYLEDGVELSLPEEIQTVDASTNADLIILPGDPETDAEQAVEWLADERVLALLGEASESTWLTWTQSETFTNAFENEGYADSEPDPHLLVAATIGLQVRTYRRTWGNGPRDRDILRALDETLVDIATETPR